jgi:D-lactate dehydrogenase
VLAPASSLQPFSLSPAHDRAPEEIALGSPAWLRDDMVAMLGAEQVHSRALDIIRYASDASPYRMFPKIIVSPRTVDEVSHIFAYAKSKKIPVTIRSAGTSLSGQSQGDGILIDARRHWAGATVEEGGKRLRVRPGTVTFHANLFLQPYGYRLGPDPASAGVATIGGVIANNSSGMCCGTTQNSYKTLLSLSFLLPSGTYINTAATDAERQFADAEPELAAGLIEIKKRIESNSTLVERLKKKFSIKNTTGYHMEAFLDGSTPLQIFRRLLVGSEGTLAFICEAVFETVHDNQHRLTAFLIFPDMHSACAAVAPLTSAGAAAVELIDRACLRAVEDKPGVPERWKFLPGEATALLVEFRKYSTDELQKAGVEAQQVLKKLTLLEKAEFTKDPTLAGHYWAIRSGLFVSVGSARKAGTSLILEDVCFPTDKLAQGALDLQALFAKHGYPSILFGHASAGNLHFVITPSLNTEADVRHYAGFVEDVISLVVDKYDGSLKAEHGTGRNIAPFVEHEWGPEITELMWKIKRLADPDMILSPDVMLTKDNQAHLRHLHTMPAVDTEVDSCIECGYCESVCPSRRITTTPRQRIVLHRELLRQPGNSILAKTLLQQYEYDAIETCAGDGSCAIACPLGINTGTLIKQLRHKQHSKTQEFFAKKIAQNWAAVEAAARAVLTLNHIAAKISGGSLVVKSVLDAARSIVGKDNIPGWLPHLPPAAAPKEPKTSRQGATAVYFRSCVNRIFGRADYAELETKSNSTKLDLAQAMVEVSARAGMPLWIPDDLAGTCCAMVWHSKGYEDGNKLMANKFVEQAWQWSDGGRLPLLCDASSCTLGIANEIVPYLTPENMSRHRQLKIIDSITWAYDYLLPKLNVRHRVPAAAIHPVCSINQLGLTQKLSMLSTALAEKTVTPIYSMCCGFAGDRGFLHPELFLSATSEEAGELEQYNCERYLCSNRTCELGLSLATGKDYESVIFLVEELTRG